MHIANRSRLFAVTAFCLLATLAGGNLGCVANDAVLDGISGGISEGVSNLLLGFANAVFEGLVPLATGGLSF